MAGADRGGDEDGVGLQALAGEVPEQGQGPLPLHGLDASTHDGAVDELVWQQVSGQVGQEGQGRGPGSRLLTGAGRGAEGHQVHEVGAP